MQEKEHSVFVDDIGRDSGVRTAGKGETTLQETVRVTSASEATGTGERRGTVRTTEPESCVWEAGTPESGSCVWEAGIPESGRHVWEGGTLEPGKREAVQGLGPLQDTEETRRLRKNFGVIAPSAIAYSVWYVFCMYRNGSGVTFPFFVAGSLWFFCFSLSKLGITLKKGSSFYMTAMLLLGISTFCTDDQFLVFFNKLGIFLLLMSFLLKQFYDTSRWKLGKYLGSMGALVFAGIGELGRLISDGKEYNKGRERKADRRVWYFVTGLLIGIPLLLFVLLLLASADAVFRQMTERLFSNIRPGDIVAILFRILVLLFASYALVAYLCKRKIRETVADTRKGEPILAITVTGLLTVTYLLFSGIQIAGLFLGRLRLPEGYTYAMYAREGFFQLLAVSFLNLVRVLAGINFFRYSKVLKIILTIMSLCTFVMIASSAMRMVIYIRYYYLTYLRILVLWALVLLVLLFAGVVVTIWKETFPLFRYHMTVTAVLYLALSFAHPDYMIAKVNLENAVTSDGEEQRMETDLLSFEGGQFFLAKEPYQDYDYISRLSADAAPVLVPWLQKMGYRMEAFHMEDPVTYAAEHNFREEGSCLDPSGFGYYWMRRIQQRTENFGVRTFNVSRHLALQSLR